MMIALKASVIGRKRASFLNGLPALVIKILVSKKGKLKPSE